MTPLVLTPADRDALFRDNLFRARVQAGLVRRPYPPGVTYDDLYAECLYTLWKAARGWDRDRASFPTYYAAACRNDLSDLIRVAWRRGLRFTGDRAAERDRDPSYRRPVVGTLSGDPPGRPRHEPDETPPPVPPGLFGRLSRRQILILTLRYADGLSLRQAAARLGVSPQAVHQAEKRAVQELREIVSADGTRPD